MVRDCPVACGICKPKPIDTHSSCGAWADDGACESNSAYMLHTCPLACALSRGGGGETPLPPAGAVMGGVGVNNRFIEAYVAGRKKLEEFCEDDPDADCAAWAADKQCDTNPGFMQRSCGRSCQVCTYLCEDLDKECPAWFASGECDKNPNGMRTSCPRHCGICQGQGKGARRAAHRPAHAGPAPPVQSPRAGAAMTSDAPPSHEAARVRVLMREAMEAAGESMDEADEEEPQPEAVEAVEAALGAHEFTEAVEVESGTRPGAVRAPLTASQRARAL
ncbi:hypothetical protein EMIHUDRAFT_205146 [Emiliania huxleyi CCMP1516]|uniref:ShKT domain-containing protein n=2 Tax=Emiliania huxleyi TaxID=2903 RepID=A0A0D3JUJ8_EMIH1|nr:hypothetical protein EMIHUDRAFT_205146 [Emiliania huxleyi CCMP1516]EOD27183.1 hypothetical protein EMIHUDRAFT_205146 [Emiliania huxleyi CCMP1516]|eukprot:XP_005779612.1 hypothetical protein EMIHUDRAFT_205146 [Emiliania huxleyi CCMP1516]